MRKDAEDSKCLDLNLINLNDKRSTTNSKTCEEVCCRLFVIQVYISINHD